MFGDCGADVNILGKGTKSGLSVTWTGDADGPRPTQLGLSPSSLWNVYGRFDGMNALSNALSAEIGNPTTKTLGITTQVLAVAQIAYLVITAFIEGGIYGVAFVSSARLVGLILVQLNSRSS